MAGPGYGIWDEAKEAYYTAVKFTLYFSLLAVIILDALGYAMGTDLYPSDLVRLNWGTSILSDAVSKLQSGLAVNILVAIPQFVLGIAALLVQLLVNSITLVNWLLKKAISIILMLIALPAENVEMLSGILAWIVETPIILGAFMSIGQAVYTFLTGGGGGGG